MNTQNELTRPATAMALAPEQQPADQIEARVGAVDQEAGRRLQHRRDQLKTVSANASSV